MEENVNERLTWSEKDLISWIRLQNWKSTGYGEAPKSISRAERVLNKIKCRGDVKDILTCLTTVDMALYIDELATVLVENCPRSEDERRWYNSYILIVANLTARYPQKFVGSWLAQVYRAEKRARDFLKCLITLSLSNVYDYSKDIRTLLTRILDKSSNIHNYVQQRRSKLSVQLSDSAIMTWDENLTFQFIENLYKNYSNDLFQSMTTSGDNFEDEQKPCDDTSGEVVDLLSISLISPRYKKGLYNMLVKYTRQRAIITLLILYEAYQTQMEDLQANRLRGNNDLEIRQKIFGRYIQNMENTIHFLLNEIALKNQEWPYSEIQATSPCTRAVAETGHSLTKLTSAQSAPTLPVQDELGDSIDSADAQLADGSVISVADDAEKGVPSQHDWKYPIARRNLEATSLINAVGTLHLKCGKGADPESIIDTELVPGELVLQSLIPKLFVDDFNSIFPKLYSIFLEMRGSKIGLLRMNNNLSANADGLANGDQTDLPIDCQVKWTDDIERNFYETLPDFRASLPSLNDGKPVEEAESPKTDTNPTIGGGAATEWQDDNILTGEIAPVSSQFDNFMAELIRFARSCAFIDRNTAYCIDEFARTYFLKLLNSRNNRRRLARQFTSGVGDVNAIPCLVRFASIIDVNSMPVPPTNISSSITSQSTAHLENHSSGGCGVNPGPILKTMVITAKQQYEKHMKNTSQSKLEPKIYWATYLCELCKFKALPVADILDILLELSQYDVFTILPSATEVVCTFLEQAGRFLAGTYGADLRLSNLITIIDRVRSRTRSIPPRVEVCLEDQLQILGACCARMRGEITPLWERLNKNGSSLKSPCSPQILYARYLINDIAAQGLWTRSTSDKMNNQHLDRYLKIKKTDISTTECTAANLCTTPSPTTTNANAADGGGGGPQEIVSFEELVRRLKTLDLKDRKVVTTLIECCLDRNNYSPTNAHMVHFLAELANELPHFVGVCVDELIYRVVYCVSGKQQRLLEAHMIANFLNYKLIDTTVGLDIVAYLIGLASTPHGASHFRTIFDCVATAAASSDNYSSETSRKEYSFEYVKRLLHHASGSPGFLDVIYHREVKEEFEEVKVVEVRSRLDTPLAQLMFAKKINHHLGANSVSEDEEYFRYKLAIALLRNCGLSIVQRVYRSRLTFMIDILYYCISYALQTSLNKSRLNAGPGNDDMGQPDHSISQKLNLRLDFEEMANHLDYPYTDLWDLTLACNNLAQFMKQIIKEIDENEADFQPLLGSEHSLLRGFKASWAHPAVNVDSHESTAAIQEGSGGGAAGDHHDLQLRNVTTEEERSPTSARSASKSDSCDLTSSNLSDYEAELDNNLFDTELNLIINESLDNAKATAPRPGNIADLRIPPKLNIKTSASESKSFRLITRQRTGGKQVFKPINVPFPPPTTSVKISEFGDTLDRQVLKRFALDRALNDDSFRDIVDCSPTCGSDHTSNHGQYRPSEATVLTRVMLYNNNNLEPGQRRAGPAGGGSLGKRAKRNKPARVRSRTTTTFLTTDSSDD